MSFFGEPFNLLFLLIIPILWYLYTKSLAKKRSSALKFSAVSLLKTAVGKEPKLRKHANIILSLIVLGLMIIAFADPHLPLKQSKEGVNVVLSIDVSGSMQAKDYAPNRMEAAKQSSKILIESLKDEDHAGIVIFETGATTSAYLSPFKDRVIRKLEGIKAKDGRTAIGDGLALAVDMASSISNKQKVVILLSDGVSNAGVIGPDEAIAYANNNKIQVYTIAMGSDGKVELGRDIFGRPIYAEVDEATLKRIADQTGGQFFKSVDGETLDEIYETISEDIEREREPTSVKDWFFVLALLIIIFQLYIVYGKYRILK